MKCYYHIYDLQGICLYFTSLIPMGWNLVCWDWECLLFQVRTPEVPIFFKYFLEMSFITIHIWPCFIIGNRIRVHVIASSVYIELGMKNASLFCLFYLIKYSWGSECVCAFLYWSGSQLNARNYWTLTITFSLALGIFTASVSHFLERR